MVRRTQRAPSGGAERALIGPDGPEDPFEQVLEAPGGQEGQGGLSSGL